MLSFLPAGVLGVLSALLLIINTVLWCVPFYLAGIAHWILPAPGWRRFWRRILMRLGEGWISCNMAIGKLAHRTDWDVRGVQDLEYEDWYLVTSNHQAWVDIPILQIALNRKIPFLKFFLKKELIWVPVLGLAWWFLGLPFMKRYSRKELEARPELRGQDLETVRRACDHFREVPCSVLNFLEGTRFTREKHDEQQSPFEHLLRPKAGGVAAVVDSMGERFRSLVDVTIVYPDGVPGFWDFLSGRLDRVIVDVMERPIPPELLNGDYEGDERFRVRFQEWIQQIWGEKEAKMKRLLSTNPSG